MRVFDALWTRVNALGLNPGYGTAALDRVEICNRPDRADAGKVPLSGENRAFPVVA